MKNITLLLILIVSLSNAQMTIDSVKGTLNYKNIIKTTLSKSELNRKATKWLEMKFKKVKGSSKHSLITKGVFDAEYVYAGYKQNGVIVKFLLAITLKDGEYILEVFDFIQSRKDYMVVENPVTYLPNYSYEEFVSEMLFELENLTDVSIDNNVKDQVRKRLKNRKDSNVDYENALITRTKVGEIVIKKCNTINQSLYNYLNNISDKLDW